MGSIREFLAELRRRHVFRVAAWYGAVAWLVIQVASTVAPQYELPPWTVRAVISAALLGFPVALLLAWAFEFTASGLQRTEPAEPQDQALHRPAWNGPSLWFALAAGVLLGVGVTQGWWAYTTGPASDAHRKSIAVLPLASLSEAPDDQHFADGLHEDIISSLSKIADLRVISRTSVMEFRDPDRNLRDIAATLGAATIIEGSVRRSGERVKITLQLIDAASDSHLWSEDYDRAFTNIFALQAEIARKVAERLEGKVTPQEARRLEPQATSLEAFTLRAKARGLMGQGPGIDGALQARSLLEAAIAADPNYAPAWASLASNYFSGFFYGVRSKEDYARARAAMQRALVLAPENAEAQALFGTFLLVLDWDLASAEVAARRAVTIEPSSTYSLNTLSHVFLVAQRFDDAIAVANRALELNPQSAGAYVWARYCFQVARRFSEAEPVIAEGLRRFPENSAMLDSRATQLRLTGRAAEAASIYERLHRLEGDEPHPRLMFKIAAAHAQAGDMANANDWYERASKEMEGSGRPWEAGEVWALGWMGRHDEAFARLEIAFQERTPNLIQLGFDYDYWPLRSDPRFADLARRIGIPIATPSHSP